MQNFFEEVIARLTQAQVEFVDDCTLEEIQYHLYVREQVGRGLADIEVGRLVSHKQAKRRIAEWRI